METSPKNKLKFRFNPDNQGLAKVLGPLEAEIMGLIWGQEQATVGMIHQALQLQRANENREIAYTTVMTTMSRLEQKKILRRQRVGLAFVYTPVMSEAEFTSSIIKDVIDGLFSEYGDMTVDYLMEYLGKSENSKLDRLEKSISAHKSTEIIS